MLEKFTKDEIKQIKKELKELGPDGDTKYFKLKNAREALRCSGIPNYYQIEMALYKICDFTLGNYSQQLTVRNAGHVHYTRRNKEIKTNVDKYKALFTRLVNMIINSYDKEAVKEAERKND